MQGDAGSGFDYEDAKRVLQARHAKATCPICGVNSWGDLGALGNLMIQLPASTPGAEGEVVIAQGQIGGLSAFALTCTNCGFVRLHAERILSDTNKPDERS
jgi:predicted RNA-binding Zn-ribbon protein involved in translation (DUF1610 family)